MEFSFTFGSVIGGYKFFWTPFIGEILSLSAVDRVLYFERSPW